MLKCNYLLIVLILLTAMAAHADTYDCEIPLTDTSIEVDGWITEFLEIPVTAGIHTIAMTAAETSIGWNDILFFQQNHGLPNESIDYCFTLNGIGDARTMTFSSPGQLHIGVFDSYIGDNSGVISFLIDGECLEVSSVLRRNWGAMKLHYRSGE